MNSKTFQLPRERALAERRWFVIDAKDAILGRLATKTADLLRGKGKPVFTPNVDCGDFVVVVNAASVRVTGDKDEKKVYYRHTGYPGGVRSETLRERRTTRPERIIRDAVEGMLPKNRLGRAIATKLKVYAGEDHPHAAQKPEHVSVGGR